MTLTPDQERWAEALAVLKMHGEAAEAFVSSRIVALADDPAGVARWQEIERRIAELRAAGSRAQ